MRRANENDLAAWYQKKDRQPLILRGARQVGKSTLVRRFCAQNSLQCIEVNLEKLKLSSLQTEHFQIDQLLEEIQLLCGKRIPEKGEGILIFFDEIQEDPRLLKMLRYFYEERPALPVVAAGSLLEIVLHQNEISFPVGRVEFLNLGPMSFFEFLEALDQQLLLKKMIALEFSEAVHRQASEFLKLYFYVGGMPRVVEHYRREQSLLEVREIQTQILEAYKADFPKYAKRLNLERLSRVFESSAAHLGSKVKYNELDPYAKARDVRKSLTLLIQARVLLQCLHCTATRTPLWAEEDLDVYKLYFLDIGLANALHGLDFKSLEKEMRNEFATKGYLAEQFVAQHLNSFYGPSLSPRLNYWLRDRGAHKGEIDFLVQFENQIIPIEVKATASGHLKSLFYFVHEKKLNKAVKISTQPFRFREVSHQIENESCRIQLIELPLYATAVLAQVLKKIQMISSAMKC